MMFKFNVYVKKKSDPHSAVEALTVLSYILMLKKLVSL